MKPDSGYQFGCVIMASGISKRFGENKLLADFNGNPLILRILNATDGLFSRRIVITRHPEIDDLCRALNIPALLHVLPYRSDTVRLGLEAIGDADGCMFCPSDQPLLTQKSIEQLIEFAKQNPECIVRPCFGDTPGSPVLFPRWAFEELMHLPDGKGGGVLIKKYPDRVRMLPIDHEYELMDADDRETFARLLEIDSGIRAYQPQTIL